MIMKTKDILTVLMVSSIFRRSAISYSSKPSGKSLPIRKIGLEYLPIDGKIHITWADLSILKTVHACAVRFGTRADI
jgi:hypothetical protein